MPFGLAPDERACLNCLLRARWTTTNADGQEALQEALAAVKSAMAIGTSPITRFSTRSREVEWVWFTRRRNRIPAGLWR